MAAELSNLDSFIPSTPALRHRFEPFCSLMVEKGSLCSSGSGSGSDSGFGSPLTSSEALASSDEDEDYLAELTRQMATDMLREKNDDGRFTPGSVPTALSIRDMARWVDLFAVSPQSTLRLPSVSTYCNKKASVPEGESNRDTQPAYEPRLAETSHKTEPVQTMSRWSHDLNHGLRSYQTFLNAGNRTKEPIVRPETSPKRANSAKRKTHAKNNQWKTRSGLVQGDYYISLSMSTPQKAGPPKADKSVLLGDHPTSSGTGVFLPKTSVNPTEEGRKPRCSTVLIPARVAQALMVHFSKTSQHRSRSSVGGGDPSLRCGPHPDYQQKGQADPEPVIHCNEMGLPLEWMY